MLNVINKNNFFIICKICKNNIQKNYLAEETLQSIIHEKKVSMILKNNGLKSYKTALIKIKKLLSENLLVI